MRLRLISPLLSAYSVVFGLATANAAEPINLRASDFKETQQQFYIALPGVKSVSAEASPDQLKLIKQHKDGHNITHFRMQQQYAGFDVIGGYAIVHSQNPLSGLLSANNQSTMNGIVYSGLQTELGKPNSNFVKNGAVALDQFAALYKGHEQSQKSVTPVVYIDSEHNAHWAYKVSLYVSYDDKIPERPTAILDAQTLKPFVQLNEIKTEENLLSPAKAKGFGGNPKLGQYAYGAGGYPYLEVMRNDTLKTCYMKNDTARVIDMKHKSASSPDPMKFSCFDQDMSDDGSYWTGYKGDGYDRDNGAYSPSNDALYAGFVINHLYKDWYGVNALSKSDGSPMELVLRVHYGQSYENAFWDGEQMTFGDGPSMFYPLVSLGVGSHEISHGFTEQHSNLNYYSQSGGMNEAFSDMAAQAAEFYSVGQSSWMIGSEIIKEDSGYETLRYMDVPSRDGESIDSADQYYSGLDVHYSSGVYNRLYYLIATTSGWTPKKSFDVMVKANMDYWTPYSTFKEGACGVISAAQDLNYSVDDVKAALSKVVINYKSCSL